MTASTGNSSTHLPERVDAARMVGERRRFEGELPFALLPQLAEDLASDEGTVRYWLEFGTGTLGGDELHVQLQASPVLECQRTLEPFAHPVEVDTRLGLLDNERQEAGLPPDVEPLLLENGTLHPVQVIEAELSLALPLVPVKPGSRLPDYATEDEPDTEADEDNPFAVLGKLKKNH